MDIHECKMLDHNAHFSYGFLLCLMDILIDSQRNLKIIFLPSLPALHLVSWQYYYYYFLFPPVTSLSPAP